MNTQDSTTSAREGKWISVEELPQWHRVHGGNPTVSMDAPHWGTLHTLNIPMRYPDAFVEAAGMRVRLRCQSCGTTGRAGAFPEYCPSCRGGEMEVQTLHTDEWIPLAEAVQDARLLTEAA